MGCTGAQVNEKMWNGMTPDQYADYMWDQPPEVRNKIVHKERIKDQILKIMEIGLDILSSVSIPRML